MKPGQSCKKEYFEALFSSMPDPIFLLNAEGKVVNINRAFTSMFGAKKKEVVGKNFADLLMVPEETDQSLLQNFKKVIGEKAFSVIEMDLLNAAGDVISVKFNGRPFNFGVETAYIFSVHDITELKATERKLRISEENYLDLLDNANDLIQSTDSEGNFIFVNKKWHEVLGYSGEELLYLKLETIVPHDELPRLHKVLREVDQGEPFKHFETILRTKDGRDVHVEGNLLATFENGEPTIIRWIFQDLTELEGVFELYITLVQSSPSAIYIVQDRVYKFVNTKFTLINGYSEKELLGMESLNIVHPEDRQFVRDSSVNVLKKSQIKPCEFRIIRKDGEIRWVMDTVLPISYQGRKASFGNLVDITEIKNMQQELQQKVKELEAVNLRLKELDKLKDSFLSTVSHELRTPLTSIKSFAEILLNYEEDRATQKEFLGIINEESDRLTRLITDFLDLSKIEAGKMHWNTVEISVTHVIETAVKAIQSQVGVNNLELSKEIEPALPFVQADKDRLVQVVTNLLSNAVKFTPSGGKISIKARLQKNDNGPDSIIVNVSDSGIGIAPEHHQSIFEKFGQVGDTLKDKPKGPGLGLPICKEIVEHYSGRIWVESELGKGSTFFFTLPLTTREASTPAVRIPQKPAEAAVLKGRTVLVVDDEAKIRRLIGHELSSRGYKVLEASSGKEAIDMAKKYLPDLITLDILMPDIDGYDVTAVLKNNAETRSIPILIVSVIEGQARAYQLGVNDYITKPFSISALMDKVVRLLHGSHKTVLVVDDDETLRKSLEYELRKQGLFTSSAPDGKKALAAVEAAHPDLILLDIKMPEMDGYEVIKAIRHNPETAGIPIIVMTGIEIDGGRVKALSFGANDYFNKSRGFGRLFEAVERILAEKTV